MKRSEGEISKKANELKTVRLCGYITLRRVLFVLAGLGRVLQEAGGFPAIGVGLERLSGINLKVQLDFILLLR